MSPPSPASSAKKTYDRRFGRSPELIAIAPGRVNLIGDHVDYAGGLVMPMAIDCCTAVAVGRDPEATDEPSVIVAADLDVECKIDLGEIQSPRQPGTPDAFLNYVTGPLEQIRKAGVSLPRMDLVIASSVPMGGGLSSSAALEIAVLLAVRTLLERKTSPLELALEAQRAEHEQAGTPCGIMDMYVSAAARPGHACMIDCMTNELRQVRMPPEDEAVVMVTDTRTRHELNDGAYATRREQCEEAARMLGWISWDRRRSRRCTRQGCPGPSIPGLVTSSRRSLVSSTLLGRWKEGTSRPRETPCSPATTPCGISTRCPALNSTCWSRPHATTVAGVSTGHA